MSLEIPVGAKADDASFKRVADHAESIFTELGGKIGNDLGESISEGLRSSESKVRTSASRLANSYDKVADSIGKTRVEQEKLSQLQDSGARNDRIVAQVDRVAKARRAEERALRQTVQAMKDYEQQAHSAHSAFGSGFSSGFSRSRVGGYFADLKAEAESSGSAAGVLAGRAMGAGITAGLGVATAGVAAVIGGLGYTLAKGFERYEAIDSAKHRLDNLNKTLAATGKAELDVKAVMDTVNDVVQGTPFSLDSAFSLSTRALSSNTGDLKRFMTVVADAAGFTGDGIDNIGDAFLQVANTGKVSMEQVSNQLRNLPILPWLQQQLGVTGSELQKLIHDNKVGLNDLMMAVEANASGFAKSAGDSLEGSISNMQTAVARTGAKVLGALFGQPTDDANTLKDAVTALTGRIDELGRWVDAHRDDIKAFFESGVSVAETLAGAVGFIGDHIELVEVAAGGLAAAFIGWKTIEGVSALLDSLGKVDNLLAKTLPDSAASGAAKMTSALGPVAVLLASLEAADWRDRLNPDDSRNIRNQVMRGDWPHALLGDAADWFGFGKSAPPAAAPAAGPAPVLGPGLAPAPAGSNFYKDWYPSIAGGSAASGAGPAGAPILDAPGVSGDSDKTPPQFDRSQWSLDSIPVPGVGPAGPLSVPAQIAGGPVPGPMSVADVIAGMPGLGLGGRGAAGRGFYQVDPQKVFDAETSMINARNRVEESRIRLLELEQKENVTQSALISAKNNVLEAERALQSAQMKAVEAQQGTLKKHTDALSELGAAIDQDFGISKGLPGIAENITKFLANLAFAPALGALQAVVYAGGGGAVGGGLPQGAAASLIGGGYPTAAGMGAASYPMPTGQPRQYQSGMVPNNVQMLSVLEQMFPGVKMSADTGRRDKYNEHGSGEALDIMVGANAALGRQINEFLLQNADALGLQYTLWQQATWRPDGSVSPMETRAGGDPTQNHMDHVHARVRSGPATGAGGFVAGGGMPSMPALGAGGYMPSAPAAIAGGPQLPAGSVIGGDGSSLPMGGVGGMPMTGTDGLPMGGVGGLPVPGLGPGAGQGLAPSVPGVLGGVPMPAAVGIAGGGGGVGGPRNSGLAPVGLAPSVGAGGEGAQGIGGLPLDAMMTAASALDVIAPGASIAAQKGIQLINRAIGYGGQLAGIGVSGLLNTVTPRGSSLGDMGNSWLGRIASGFAGARPSGQNMAGQSTLPNPEDARKKAGQGGDAGATTNNNTTNITVDGRNQNDQQLANEVAYQHHAVNQYTKPGPGR